MSDSSVQSSDLAASRVAEIRMRLQSAFSPISLNIRDDSEKHRGHAGARDGRGHFHVEICAETFASQSLLQRHRAVYQALGSLMQSDIHALSLDATAPSPALQP